MRRGLYRVALLGFAMSLLVVANLPGHAQEKDFPTPKKDSATAKKDGTTAKEKEKEPKADPAVDTLRKDIDALMEKSKAAEKTVGDLKEKLADTESAREKTEAALKAAQSKVDAAIEEAKKTATQSKADLEAFKKEVTEKQGGISEKVLTDKLAEVAKTGADALTPVNDNVTKALKGGDNAWMMTSSAFVLLMLPGLALFYGGMVRKKNVLATMMHSMAALAVVGVVWIAYGYGMAFGPSKIMVPEMWGVKDGGFLGWDAKFFFFKGVKADDVLPGYNIPVYTHAMFQGMFAIITGALISGAWAERIRFWPFCIFLTIWTTVVYCPLAHMVWSMDFFTAEPLDAVKGAGNSATGFLGKLGALDFAGGTVVHIAAGISGLAGCFVLKKRAGYPEHVTHPNSMVLTLIGAGLLWFGWFGFNGGSGLNSTPLASSAFAATQAAAAAAGLTWMLVEWIIKGKPTALGLASGIVAGLVAVTPASGFVYMWGGAIIGVLAGLVCYASVALKPFLRYDDSLDAFGVHAVGGFLGAVLTGFLCFSDVNSAGNDGFLAYNGRASRLAAIDPEIDAATKAVADAVATNEKDKADIEAKEKEYDTKIAKIDAEVKGEPTWEQNDEKTDLTKSKGDLSAKVTLRKKTADDNYNALKTEKKKLLAAIDGDKSEADATKARTAVSQPVIQFKAALVSLVYAFVVSLVLVALVQVMTLGNFRTNSRDETDGLDRSEHGEIGFDYGITGESILSGPNPTPRAAKTPPGGKRFSVVVEGIENGGLMKAWSELCQPVTGAAVDADFKAIYPQVTTVQGNRFRFRGGDATALSTHLQKLFQKKLGKPLKVRVEE